MKADQFIEQLNRKRPEAFRALFGSYCRALILYALDFNVNQDVAEDIVQEIFVRIYEGDSSFPNVEALRSYLYTSVRNRCLNHIRHTRIEQSYIRQASADRQETEMEEEGAIELKIIREEAYRKIFAVLETLPPQCRKIFEMHLEGRSNEDIATLLQISIHTVKTQKKRAMKQFREQLGDLYFWLLLWEFFQ